MSQEPGSPRAGPSQAEAGLHGAPLGPFEQPRTPLGRALLADAKADGVELSRSGRSNTGYVGVHFTGTGYRVQTCGAFTSVHGATYRPAEHAAIARARRRSSSDSSLYRIRNEKNEL